MASVTSLGLHQPTALQYAIQEQLIPEEAPSSQYSWDISVDHDAATEGEDELLVTKDTVIWSRGNIFQKCFGFALEKEPVIQALLAYFPSEEQSQHHISRHGSKPKYAADGRPLCKALVVFFKTQAHICFLDGTSHLLHMPFEVEYALPAPQGVIMQRKRRVESHLTASIKFPPTPNNSFVSTTVSPASVRSSMQNIFTTETLGKPKALPLRLGTAINSTLNLAESRDDSYWPRLVTLTDPLLDIGLVVTSQSDRTAGQRQRRPYTDVPKFLEPTEEILHVEEVPGSPSSKQDGAPKVVLAVTVDRTRSVYSVWEFSYIQNEDPFRTPQKLAKRQVERRRSSMQPGAVLSPLQTDFSESFGAALPKTRRKSDKLEKAAKVADISSLAEVEQAAGVPRRVSNRLARADIPANQERTAFGDQAQLPNLTTGRRDTSHASARGRVSAILPGGAYGGNVGRAMNSHASFLESPIDYLLDELHGSGVFEGFHNMGLDDHDFDGLTQEIMLTKIHSVPMYPSNVRFSQLNQPARSLFRVFCLVGPPPDDDVLHSRQVRISIQDPTEKRLQVLTLTIKESSPDKKNVVAVGDVTKARGVVDSCKIVDGDIAMVLVLSESESGQRELSLQSPWSGLWIPFSLPSTLTLANLRNLDYRSSLPSTREVGKRRAVTSLAGQIGGIRHPMLNGVVDILDSGTQQLHQIRIQLRPSCPLVAKILGLLGHVLPPSHGERLLVCWWKIVHLLQQESLKVAHLEWSAVVIQLFIMYLDFGTTGPETPFSAPRPSPVAARSRSLMRSSSGAQVDQGDWDAMNTLENPNSSTSPAWASHKAWQWIVEEDDGIFQPSDKEAEVDFTTVHLQHALAYMSRLDVADWPLIPASNKADHAQSVLVALHLLLEEQKLDITASHPLSPGLSDMRLLLLQLAKWMRWRQWVSLYELDMPSNSWAAATCSSPKVELSLAVPEPAPWSVLEWIRVNLVEETGMPSAPPPPCSHMAAELLPRTRMFESLFARLKTKGRTPVGFVEAMHESGFTSVGLESLPDALLVPLQDVIAHCQPHPPSDWAKELLALVDRSDVGSVLLPLADGRLHSTRVISPSHEASWDFNSLCQNVMEFKDDEFNDGAESDKQAVIRSLFTDDRRLEESKAMLNTTRPRVVAVNAEPHCSEAVYLEQQKEVVTRLATNTLSIPPGRGLMNYSLRFPLLTQKFHISGFVLNCNVKPAKTTVGVDKSLFTEDKIAWAFFHSGVAAGLSISRQAKGIDTSWILYNKPGNELNNRHAGFLLALGLNGHLKGMVKWVTFKYLTPKHAMTSVGLLLGLAASHVGSMDSLVLRLCSVHVTRMLPRGSAELNLVPITQTAGILGIGLLYCNSQHRRMSEIMMSEIKHIETEDDEEPLRSESYRLAAGFALGFVNLGKGADLKGLHDMRITEDLLTLATATKKVELVHILDRSSAAAVVALILIYLKSEDSIVARKIDVPEAMLQFDYIRPDILLLRTMAKHLILWSAMEPSQDWIKRNLPAQYRSQYQDMVLKLEDSKHGSLKSTDLPFLTILAGLCFAMALRYAGSGFRDARDVLLVFLKLFHGFCKGAKPKDSFDERIVQLTARMCLDVLAVSAAIVMAGTCDLEVLRLLRSLHGRNDDQTSYGSHMAAHMAIGVLNLGCGTHTFGTGNMAIASLLVAFYPAWPNSVMDNRSHLQAFRHLWVLATEPRCLVTKDVKTGNVVSVPVSILVQYKEVGKRGGVIRRKEVKSTPCLLPPLHEISALMTESPEFWDLRLDFGDEQARGRTLRDRFKTSQTLYLRRKTTGANPFTETMLALGRQPAADGGDPAQPLEWVFDKAASLCSLTQAERGIVLDRNVGGPDVGMSRGSEVDSRLALEEAVRSGRRDDLMGLQLLFEWVAWRAGQVKDGDKRQREEEEKKERRRRAKGKEREGTLVPEAGEMVEEQGWAGASWLRESVVESLKGQVWMASRDLDGGA